MQFCAFEVKMFAANIEKHRSNLKRLAPPENQLNKETWLSEIQWYVPD